MSTGTACAQEAKRPPTRAQARPRQAEAHPARGERLRPCDAPPPAEFLEIPLREAVRQLAAYTCQPRSSQLASGHAHALNALLRGGQLHG